MTNDAQFNSQLYNALAARVSGDFQMFGNPTPFSFPVTSLGQMDAGLYQLLAARPDWKLVGAPGGSATLYEGYVAALGALQLRVSPDRQRTLQEAQDALTRANNDLTALYAKANQAYNVAKQNGGAVFAAMYPTLDAWIKGPQGQTYANQEASLKDAVDKATQYVNTVVGLQFPDIKQARDAIVAPADDATTAPPGWVRVADNGVLHWKPSFTLGKTADQLRAELSAGSIGAFTSTLDSSVSTVDASRGWAAGQGGYETAFWSLVGGGSTEHSSLLATDTRLKVDVSAKSLTTIPVTPGDWFHGDVLARIAKGGDVDLTPPWVPSGGKSAIFGPGGVVGTMVSGLVVAYKPSVTMSMSDTTYQAVHKRIAGGGGIRVGPFVFGASASSQQDSQVTTDRAGTLAIETKSEDPVILGYVVGYPGGRKQ